MSDGRWAVHILGPDDLQYVDGGMVAAMNLANEINAIVAREWNLSSYRPTRKDPLCWAVPVPPGNTAAIVRKQ
ncbi:hypothetical protein PBI_BEAGLE_57 [Arthrobacter phage Beagle]|nr:hypothetical protein PBI_BEAGLE_57 [Arthrobacter phage Beagle]QOP66808.1 hypothetical protein SEA_ODYSSEY395_59 [Arthrobacter phage Odyssey395]